MDLGLSGRVAVVTGSSRGIGRSIAESLAAEGAHVVLNARGADTLQQVAHELASRGTQVLDVAADLTTPDGCQHLVERALERFGRIDILVNNVGGGGASSLADADDLWHASLNLTFWPSLWMTRLAVPAMRQQGGGVVIMIASIYGREAGGRAGYQVAKSAEISLAKALAKE